MCVRHPNPTPNSRDGLMLVQSPFWPLGTVLCTHSPSPITKCCLMHVQCPLQPLSDVLCTNSSFGHKEPSCTHAVPLLSTRCCLAHTHTLSKLLCGPGNYIPGASPPPQRVDRQDPGLVFARGNRFFLNVKGSTWSLCEACGFCRHLATCVFFPLHSCLLLAIATNDAS